MTPQEIMGWAMAIGFVAMSAFACVFVACVAFDLIRDRWRRQGGRRER